MKITAILATVLGLGSFWGTRSMMLPSPSQAVNLIASSPSADASKRAEKSSAQRRPTRDEIFNAVDEDRLVLLVRWLATATAGEVAEMAAALEQTKRVQQGLWAAAAGRWVEVAPEPAFLFARPLSVAEIDGPDGASWRNSAITIKSVEVYNYKKITKNQVMSQKFIVPPPPHPPFDIETSEPIGPPWQAIRAWIPADDDEPPTDTPELWDQTTDTGWKAPEIDLGDGRTPVLEYT